VRMREWQDLHAQLEDASAELGLERSTNPASYKALHQAVLTGFLGQIGHLDEGREYRGARGARFVIAPGTPLAARPPRWVVAASLTETTRVYARMAAAVEPVWIEAAAAHLTRRTYSGAHWAPTRGSVLAYEAVALYGLTLASQRRINYAAVAPREAHEIFVRDALVDPRSDLPLDFLQANRRLRAQIEHIEAKIRRRDVLASDEVQTQFYRARIPEHVSSVAALERWWRQIGAGERLRLQLSPSELMRRPVPELEGGAFPEELGVGANRLPLRYVFEPSAPDDGITLIIPQALCEELDPEQLAWLVPGARHEKITTLLRALPKAIRKQLVPVPEQAQTALDALAAQQRFGGAAAGGELPPFHEWLAAWVSHASGTAVSAAELAALPLPAHLRLNVRVLPTGAFAAAATHASSSEVLAEGRDVAAIKRRVRALELNARTTSEPQAAAHREWDFGELPEVLDVERGGVHLSLYPAIVDRGNGVARLELASRTDAAAVSRRAVARLAALALPQQARDARRRIADDRELVLLALGLSLARPLPEALCDRAFADCFVPPAEPLPRSRAQFEAAIAAHRAELVPTLERTVAAVRTLLAHWRAIRAALAELHPRAFAAAIADIENQLAGLLPPDFIEATAAPWVEELDRYLQAIRRRIARLAGNLARDAELMQRVQPFAAALGALVAEPLPSQARAAAQQLRWMIEEFRVSLFAQELKTRLPVSEKRLAEQLERARKAAGT